MDQLHRGIVCSGERMVKNWGPRLRVALCCTAFLPFYRLTFLQALFFLTVRRFVSERVKNRYEELKIAVLVHLRMISRVVAKNERMRSRDPI